MKIKEDCDVCSSDFWYDLTWGGYLKPEEILEDPDDIERVQNALRVLTEFESACEDQIPGFVQ